MKTALKLAPVLIPIVGVLACTSIDVPDHEAMWKEVTVEHKALVLTDPAARPVWNPPGLAKKVRIQP